MNAKRSFPIVVIGPGDTSIAHQPGEFVEVEEYLNSIQLYKEIAKRFLGNR